MAIICVSDRHWMQLAEVMGRHDLAADPDLQTSPGRAAHMEEIDLVVGEWTARSATAALMEVLQAVDVPSAPVLGLADLLVDPHIQARGMLRRVEQPGQGEMVTYGNPIRLSDSVAAVPAPAPDLGQLSGEVLRERLGLDDRQVAGLADRGVI